jgi:DnaJ-class molecular chaperone
MKDYYRILQVHQEAEQEVVSAAYKRLAQKYHPDKYTNLLDQQVAEEKMKEINEAYERLGDVEQRACYDQELYNYESEPEPEQGCFKVLREKVN